MGFAQKISQLPGVGLVSVNGGQRPAVRIQADTRKLAAYGLNIDDLRTTLANANVNIPKGNFDGPARAYTINANDQITSAAAYRDLIIAYKNGAPVRLSDVAEVVGGPENSQIGSWVNTEPKSFSTCSGSRARMSSRSPTASRPCCRSSSKHYRRR